MWLDLNGNSLRRRERAKQPGCDLRNGRSELLPQWQHHRFFLSWGLLKRRIQNCCSRASLIWLLHPTLNTIEMVAHEKGLLKIYPMSGAGVSTGVAAGPGPVRRSIGPVHRKRCICMNLTRSANIQLWWHHFCGELSVQPPFLSPSLSHSLYVSLCPQAMAIRCCQGHPFLKRVWWGSPGNFADRGHTCIK